MDIDFQNNEAASRLANAYFSLLNKIQLPPSECQLVKMPLVLSEPVPRVGKFKHAY